MARVSHSKIVRHPGYLYYIGKDGYVWQTPMRGKTGSKKRVGTEKINREKGWLYYVDGEGYVSRAAQRRR